MGLEKSNYSGKTFASIISDGSIRVRSAEGIEGAVRRDYELKDGTKGYKYEIVYASLSGIIQGLEFKDGEYGRSLNLTVDGIILSVATNGNFGQDLMKKLPNVSLNENVTIVPYSFEDDNGKSRKGLTIYQNKIKILSYFHKMVEGKAVNINGFPVPEVKDNGEKRSKNEWIMYFLKVEDFLVDYTEKNIKPKLAGAMAEVRETPLKESSEWPEEVPANTADDYPL